MIRRPSKHAMAIRNTLGVDRISSDRRARIAFREGGAIFSERLWQSIFLALEGLGRACEGGRRQGAHL